MDFLDPKMHRRHTHLLFVGYFMIGFAILIGTYILFKIAFGFGVGKNGDIVQNGFLYLSSVPQGASIRVNGELENQQTNARLSLPEATYNVQLEREGYQPWSRSIPLVGGSVARYDYPFLFPTNLVTTPLKIYDIAPSLSMQSPDRRWLLVQHGDNAAVFDMLDLKGKTQTTTTLTIPDGIVTAGENSTWKTVEWSTDNRHVLLAHSYSTTTEFIMLDRSDPTKSINLNTTLDITPTKITLRDKKYDQYFVYDATSQILSTATIDEPTPKTYLEHVLDYQTYGPNIVLYASSSSSGAQRVAIDLLQNGKTYSLKEVPAGTNYLLNLTRYSGNWYVAIGAGSENKVFVYKNPVSQLNTKLGVLTPIYILKTPAPNYVGFSANAQFIAAENGSQFAVYDALNDKGYVYDAGQPIDAPQAHATWMDGDRLMYSTGGKLLVFDYDHTNVHTLMSNQPEYLPAFDTTYKLVDAFAKQKDGKLSLTTTSLRTPADQ